MRSNELLNCQSLLKRRAVEIAALASLCAAICVAPSSSAELQQDSAAWSGAQESYPQVITLRITTPTQEEFTVGAAPGSLVNVRNNQTGFEFAFQIEVLEGETSLDNTDIDKSPPLALRLAIYEVSSSAQGSSLKLLAEAKGLHMGAEFLDSITGFVFKPIRLRGTKTQDSSLSEGSLFMCCMNCGFYTICAGSVSGCGGACYNYLLPIPSQVKNIELSFRPKKTSSSISVGLSSNMEMK